MGLIGSIFTAVTGIPGAADRALLDALCLACVADGATSDLEQGYALGIALELPGFARTSREALEQKIAESLQAMHRDESKQASMKRIARALGSDEQREQAFALAAVIVNVDMEARDVECSFLGAFRNELGVPPARANAILAEINRELDEVRRGQLPVPGT